MPETEQGVRPLFERCRRLAAWGVHLYTAAGTLCAFGALFAAVRGDLRQAFFWLAAQVAIDASDGALARLVEVRRVLPQIDGNRLDDIVDYLTYVFVPAAIVVTAPLVPGPAGWAAASAMLLSSAFGFARADAKTPDHFFTGFPSYWNIVVLYLVAFRSGPAVSAAVLWALAALVFVPLRYVYPSRTPVLRALTNALGLSWAAAMLIVTARLPDPPAILLNASLVFPVYYVLLSVWLDWRSRRTGVGAR